MGTDPHPAERPLVRPGAERPLFRPERLAVEWLDTSSTAADNLRLLLRGPKIPKYILLGPYFRTFIQPGNFPRKAIAASLLLHAAFILFPVPDFPGRKPVQPPADEPRYQLTWYGPPKDLKPLAPPARMAIAAAARGDGALLGLVGAARRLIGR